MIREFHVLVRDLCILEYDIKGQSAGGMGG